LDEYIDVYMEREVADLETRCNPNLPKGIEIIDTAPVGADTPKLSKDVRAARYEVIMDAPLLPGDTPRGVERFPAESVDPGGTRASKRSLPIESLESELAGRFAAGGRDRSQRPDELAPALLETRVREDGGKVRIEYLSTMREGKSVFPEDLLATVLECPGTSDKSVRVVRTALYVQRHGEYLSPISKGVVHKST
jgi:hypothetical protein